MTTNATTNDQVRARLESIDDERVTLSVPGTDYRLDLVLDGEAGSITTPVGKRIRGTIHASALRVHPTSAGGKFIEPVWGTPRIVTGTVVVADADQGRVLVDVAVPMWVTTPEGQDFSVIVPGEMVNFYVESGCVFTPAAE